jgi:hypothetical protein
LEAAWVEHLVTVPPEGGKIARLSFEEQVFVAADADPLVGSNVDQEFWDRLDDMAAIYYQLRRYVDWVKRTLTPTTGATVELYAFSEVDTVEPFDFIPPNECFYRYSTTEIVFGTEFSRYELRDGRYDGAFGDEAPENGEWHEFNHHLWGQFVLRELENCTGNGHLGYFNPNTCPSMKEGIATFFAAAASQDLDGATDSFYDGISDLEWHTKAWDLRTGLHGGLRYSAEDLAVAALLWDLLDSVADTEQTSVIAQDGSHRPVTYTDLESRSIADLWNHLVATRPLTVADLRASFGAPDLTINLDGDVDGTLDIAPIDQVFLMHGFFPIDHDQTSTHRSYHYDVNYAQRENATAARNAAVGLSSHRFYTADRVVTDVFIPRSKTPTEPRAAFDLDVVDASGTPISGAEVDLVIEGPDGIPTTSMRRLGGGEGSAVSIELPSYFSSLLADDEPLPACDPTIDLSYTLRMQARVNGFVSEDSPSFDNCTYQRAIEAPGQGAALAFTPPVTTFQIVASTAVTPTTAGNPWTVRLACTDSTEAGFASGCARIEYRLNGGALETWERSLVLEDAGPHLLAFRSVDAAGNEEAIQVIPLPEPGIMEALLGIVPVMFGLLGRAGGARNANRSRAGG